jgi:hypothetical protein
MVLQVGGGNAAWADCYAGRGGNAAWVDWYAGRGGNEISSAYNVHFSKFNKIVFEVRFLCASKQELF